LNTVVSLYFYKSLYDTKISIVESASEGLKKCNLTRRIPLNPTPTRATQGKHKPTVEHEKQVSGENGRTKGLIGTRPWIRIMYASRMSPRLLASESWQESSIDDRKSERHLARESLDV